MRRLVLALVASLGLAGVTSVGAGADVGLTGLISTTQATLSCTDGHSVTMAVDAATLQSLTADVGAINAAATGMSCNLNTTSTDSSSERSEWTVYDYNPSDQAIRPRNSPNDMPATGASAGNTADWQFNFLPSVYTALFTTTDPNLTGNLSGRTLTDLISVSNSIGTFLSQHGDGCNAPATVRFYFASPSASGSSTGTPPAGFYTKFWWSDAQAVPLVSFNESQSISESMSDLADWSDWNGTPAAAVPEAFIEATQKVQTIGLSFGGGCFFENGVTFVYATPPPDYETFESRFSEN